VMAIPAVSIWFKVVIPTNNCVNQPLNMKTFQNNQAIERPKNMAISCVA
jgi:hypothetical protein